MKILIVDDDVVSRMMLMHMIASADAGPFDVLEAEDGEAAWGQLDGGMAPALLFCDLRMPRLSGMELLARVKADGRFGALPFVLVSAAGDAATMEQALGLGADGYIVKPFDGARVAAHLARLLPPLHAGGRAGTKTGDADPEESPAATMRRLGIDAVRLALYLEGLQRQLEAAAPELAQLLAAGRVDAAQAQLARLGAGCRTLGLFSAAADFDALHRMRVPEDGAVPLALDAAGQAVLRQREAVRRLH